MDKNLNIACEAILKKLVQKYPFLHPHSNNHDMWDSKDACEVVATLVSLINYSNEIEEASKKYDWGK